MPEDPTSLIGHILDVQGSAFITDLTNEEEGVIPTVTIGDEDIAVGRIGSYVRIHQGNLGINAMVARMSQRVGTDKATEKPIVPAEPISKGTTSARSRVRDAVTRSRLWSSSRRGVALE